MEAKEIEGLVEAVAERAFNVVKGAYDFQKELSGASNAQDAGTRIIFPKCDKRRKSGEADRISEQELRFVFVEQLNKYLDEKGIGCVYYSVETPTKNAHSFEGESERSARTDLTLHGGKFDRVCLIEFKALNPKKEKLRKGHYQAKKRGLLSQVPYSNCKECKRRHYSEPKRKNSCHKRKRHPLPLLLP